MMGPLGHIASSFVFIIMVMSGTQNALAEQVKASRVIAIGGSVTEIVYALGQQDRLVGRDRTSVYPPEATVLPDVGYMRALSPEGVLSVEPDLILAVDGAGPPDAIAVLEEAGVQFVSISNEFTRDGVAEKIRAVGAALGVEGAANALAEQTVNKIDDAHSMALGASGDVRVLFVLSAQDNRILVGGADTQADSIIRLAGGVNAAADVPGFKPITPEALAAASPDVILMMDRSDDHPMGAGDLFSLPALKLTPAGRNENLIRMQGAYLLGFGPRTAEAIADLSAALQGVSGS